MNVKIYTRCNPPPIPTQAFDWSATADGYEPGSPIGYGPTEQDAIDDLIDQLTDVYDNVTVGEIVGQA